MTSPSPPTHDDAGINLADPHDKRGLKTDYISILQSMALERYVRPRPGRAVDLGCGYGRMTRRLCNLGHDALGIDPSHRVLTHASRTFPDIEFCAGALPKLPLSKESVDTIFLLSVIRVLHLMKIKEVCSDVARPLKPGGRLVIIDNVRLDDDRYIDESWHEVFFNTKGLKLKARVSIRASRWPVIYMIRYGLVPRRLFERIAAWELDRMAGKHRPPRWGYHNVLWVFEKK